MLNRITNCTLFLFALVGVLGNSLHAAESDLPQFERSWGDVGSAQGEFLAARSGTSISNGNVYIADSGNDRIQVFDRRGQFIEEYGQEGSAPGQFDAPVAIAIDETNNWIYVLESGNLRVQKFDMQWNYILSFTETATSPGDSSWTSPQGIAVDPVTKNVWVAVNSEDRIDVHDSNGNYLTSFNVGGNLTSPRTVFFYDNEAYLSSNTTVHVINPLTGALLRSFGTFGIGDGQFNDIRGIAADFDGYIYVADDNGSEHSRVQKFNRTDGTFVGKFGSSGERDGQFILLNSFWGSVNGADFYTTEGNQRVQKFSFPYVVDRPIITDITWDNSSVIVTFIPVFGLPDYEICYGVSPSYEDVCVEYEVGDVTAQDQYIVEGLDPSETYLFAIRAVGQYNRGPLSVPGVLPAQATSQESPGLLPETGYQVIFTQIVGLIALTALISGKSKKFRF